MAHLSAICVTAMSLILPSILASADTGNFSFLPAINYLLLEENDNPPPPPPPLLPPPSSQFNVGDSIGVGEAANGTIGEAHPESVWSTGYDYTDLVNSLNERFEARDGSAYLENNLSRNTMFNHAVSGAVMADFQVQAEQVVAAAVSAPGGDAGMVTVLLGSNDVCAENLANMTDPVEFETQFRAGLDVLAASSPTRSAQIHVSSIPDIYWLWEAKRGNALCRILIWPFVPCQNLLDKPADDCANADSRLHPDTISAGDGPNCTRRKLVHARIRDDYNPILKNVLQEYQENNGLPNASFIDIFDVRFGEADVNSGDCFHPSKAGHALLARKQWCRSKWGEGEPVCATEQ